MTKKEPTDTCHPSDFELKATVSNPKLPKSLKKKMMAAVENYVKSKGFSSVKEFIEKTGGFIDQPIEVKMEKRESKQVQKNIEKLKAEEEN